MLDELKESTKSSMDKAVQSLVEDLKKVRTGRANVSMLDSVKVSYYGSLNPLNQVASVSCPDAKSFLISPWEVSIIKDIEAAIIKSNLGMAPQSDGKVIRLKVPELTEERRRDMVKSIKKTVEDARVSVRMARRDANELIKAAQKDKEISEDDEKVYLAEIQNITDDYIKKVDKISDEKEKELLTI
jgi:ribosome recycling factor